MPFQKSSLSIPQILVGRIDTLRPTAYLPSVFFQALDKEASNKKHSGKKTLGKEACLPNIKKDTQ
jgi:hypothetical protein